MHLKTLTLRGFKSFASATKLELEPGITCVVGPNGSGKSNVVDALAWVMGEQGAKNLRGGSMEDVIFAGTSTRQALGRAEVAVTIDNSDAALPIDFTEVTLSRTLFRAGGSEYRINGEPARLLDIQELLSDSGLGKEMHVVVGQGRLEAILSADPQGRRGFIEEAAGVLKHRKRKEKALRKLTGLQTNLDRVSDLRRELAGQLGPLARQAKAARRAQTVQAVLRDSVARLLADDLVQAQARAAAAQPHEDPAQRARELEEAVRTLDEKLTAAEAERREFERGTEAAHSRRTELAAQFQRATSAAQRAADRVRFLRTPTAGPAQGDSPEALRDRAGKLVEELTEARSQTHAREQALAELGEERAGLEESLARADRELSHARARAAARMRTRAGLESAHQVAHSALARARAALASLEETRQQSEEGIAAAEARVTAAAGSLAECEAGEAELDAAHTRAESSAAELRAQREQLREQEDRLRAEQTRSRAEAEGQRAGARLAADTESLLAADIPGLLGALAQWLRVTPGCEAALVAALGTAGSTVLAADRASALAVLDHVGEDGLVEVLHPVEHGPSAEERRGAVRADTDAAGVSESWAVGTDATPPLAGPPASDDTVPAAALLAVAMPGADPTSSAGREAAGETDTADAAAGHRTAGLARTLSSVLAGVRVAGSQQAALARLDAHEEETLVLLDGTVFSSGRSARTGSGEADRLAARTALLETEAHLEALGTELAGVRALLAELHAPLADAENAEAQALAALHASDAAIVAAGEELSRTSGELARVREDAEQAAEARTAAQERIRAARDEEETARAALEAQGPAEADEEPSTEARDELSDALTALGERSVEARVSLRAAQDRTAHLEDRIHGLRRRADREEAAREEAARAARVRAEQAGRCAEIERAAAALAQRLRVWQDDAEAALTARAQRRTQLDESEERLRVHRKEAADAMAQAASAEHRAQLQRERHRLRVEELSRKAEEETGLSAESLVEQFGPHLPVPALDEPAETDPPATAPQGETDPPEETDPQEAAGAPQRHYVRAEVERARTRAQRELTAIGQVNPLALEEYSALQERHDYLERQITDIERTRAELLTLVGDVDRHVQEVFEAAFADTQREFAHIFERVFPGGEGRLELTDPSDMLASGIEVMARPAGKRVKRLSLLSGGERSLVAIAMLVAIFRARPSPFYIMDEVEAALDDANLSRLLTLFEELRETSQLIVITHQRRTMEIADALYGVTMHGDGVSQVISQRLQRSARD